VGTTDNNSVVVIVVVVNYSFPGFYLETKRVSIFSGLDRLPAVM